MIFTTQMTQLFAVVLDKDQEAVTEALLREGVMQFISTSEIDSKGSRRFSSVGPAGLRTDVSELRKRVGGLLHTVGIVPSPPHESDLANRISVDMEKEKARIDKLEGERDSIRDRQRSIQQEILRLEDIQRQVDVYGKGLEGIQLSSRHALLSIQSGKIPVSHVPRLEAGLKDLPAMHLTLGQENDTGYHMLISMKRDRERIAKVLSQVGWVDFELPKEFVSGKKDLAAGVSEKLGVLTSEQRRLQDKVTTLIKKQEGHLNQLWVNLRISELCSRIQANFESSSRAAVFAGWLPAAKKDRLNEVITQASEGRCYLEWHEPDNQAVIEDEVPVKFNNPRFLAPFQLLVSNFGIPRYGTIDPTPFLVPLYLTMFGLMFADVGHGFVLGLVGVIGIFAFKGRKKAYKSYYDLSWLIVWCSLSAILFGALLGSYFGMGLLKPLWFDFHGIVSGHNEEGSVISDVNDVLALTIYFGIVVIWLGLLFNWINIIRTRQWVELIFDKGGVLGAWIYGGGIYVARYVASHDFKEYPSGRVLLLLVGIPSLLFLAKEPYHYFKHERPESGDKTSLLRKLPGFVMCWGVEVLEVFVGYLSNTLSFMRVAGLGIAHVCLMIAFFTLADMTSGIFSIMIIIFGNALVIALEGLSAGVQALRLNYYEFFDKFFHGAGRLHSPISLSSEL